jgi:carboxyl-terminal processing protease
MLTRTGRRWARPIREVAGLMALTIAIVVPASAREQSLPSAAELVAKHVAAIGGVDAIRAVTSMRATGVAEVPVQNLRGTFEMLSGRPAKAVLRVELPGLGKIESGFNGVVGWSLDPMVGPSLVTGRMLDEMRSDAHFDADLHPPDLVKSMTTAGRVEFDRRPAFKVNVVYVSGQLQDEYFDADTGLLLGTEGEVQTPMGPVRAVLMARDYKAFGALKHATRLVQSAMGVEQHFVIERIEYNTVKPEAFDPPPIIKAIIKSDPPPPWMADAVASFDEAWSTINDTFYDPGFGGLDWNAVRDELRPRVTSADSPAAARAVIVEMLARLKRSHFVLLSSVAAADDPRPAGNATVDIDLRVFDHDVVITRVGPESLASKAGLAPGQILLSVDGIKAASWWRTKAGDVDPRVAAGDAWRRAERSLRGLNGSVMALVVRDSRGEHSITVRRAAESGERVVLGDLPPMLTRVDSRAVETPGGRAAGVVGFNVWMTPIDDPLARAIDRHRAAKGIVIDLRGNPGGLAAMIQGVAGHFFATTELLGRMKMRTSELEFRANPRIVTPDGVRVEPYAGKVAIIVDELTASASECFAGAMQSLGRARIFGRQTAGQALPAATRRLSNGDLLMHVVGDFVTATGRRLEGEGVVPDEVVPFSLDALRAGRDAALDAALRWVDQS